jgi:small membrane protein
MDAGQTVIKIILVVVLAAFAVFLMIPGRGQRHVAIRRLLMLVLLALVVLAVIFPPAVTAVAHLVGVGRGADLLLYGLIVVFAGNSILVQRRHRNTEREITILARQLAILQAPQPAEVREPVPEQKPETQAEDTNAQAESSGVS